MKNEKSRVELYFRSFFRILACICIGLTANLVLILLIFLWCSIFFPIISLQYEFFTWIFIDLGLFLGTSLAGHLSITLKKCMVTTVCIAMILGTAFLIITSVLISIFAILSIMLGGLIGGGMGEKIKEMIGKNQALHKESVGSPYNENVAQNAPPN
ncbi:MAG: hypothetical protein ACTSYB_07460 [Candidatus Helarchaeota archaeon]